jgi:hypothetical protein
MSAPFSRGSLSQARKQNVAGLVSSLKKRAHRIRQETGPLFEFPLKITELKYCDLFSFDFRFPSSNELPDSEIKRKCYFPCQQ